MIMVYHADPPTSEAGHDVTKSPSSKINMHRLAVCQDVAAIYPNLSNWIPADLALSAR